MNFVKTVVSGVVRVWKGVFGSEPLVAANLAIASGIAVYQEVQAELALTAETGVAAVVFAVATVLVRKAVTPNTRVPTS